MQRIKALRPSYFGEMSLAIWKSKDFRVHSYKDNGCIRLDIEKIDGTDSITWDEMQKIKDDCGFANKDAIEFYPANDAVINTGNWRHIYIFNELLPLIRR